MHSRLQSLGLAGIAAQARGQRTPDVRRRRPAVRVSGSSCARLAGQSRARTAPRRPTTYYNFNLRLEATNVCVASCLFCSFARLSPGDAGRLHDVARTGVRQASAARRPAAHRSARRQRPPSGPAVRVLPRLAARPEAHPSRDPSEVLHRGGDRVLRRDLRHDRRAGPARADGRRTRLAARRRRGDLRRTRAAEDLPRQGGRRSLSRRSIGSRIGSACGRTSRCSTGTSRRWRSASITCCARGRCRTRPAGSRRSFRWRFIPTTTRCASCRRRRRPTRCACTPWLG